MEDCTSFITTKLKIPTPRRNCIVRPQIIRKLDELFLYKLTIVKGTAGSGKTTLLASYAREHALHPFYWITLDAENNDMFSFWNYFLEAVSAALGEKGRSLLHSFHTMMNGDDIRQLLILLINQLDSQGSLTLVLDDFQHIREESLLSSLEFLLRYSPDNLHLVLLTREEPALYTADLLMEGRLLLLNEDDLKISDAEAAEFLRTTLSLPLDDATANEINRIAEGWIGGIQLIALASVNKSHLRQDLRVLSRSTIEYLSRELLDSLGPQERDFLVKTSILGYFNKNICQQFLQISNYEEILELLLSRNLFLINMDDQNGIYRYHHIFGEFLQFQFSRLEDPVKRQLHVDAAQIFEALGDLDESVRQLLKAGNWTNALTVVSRMEQVQKRWTYFSQIPLDVLTEDRDSAFQLFFFYYCNLQWDKCRQLLEVLEEKINTLPAWKAFRHAKALIYDLDLEVDILSLEEIEQLNFNDTARAILYIKTSAFLRIQDKHREAMEFIGKAAELAPTLGNSYIEYFVPNMKSQIKEDFGDLCECLELYEETFRIIEQNSYLHPLLFNNYIGITGVYLKRMELEKAAHYLNESLHFMQIDNTSNDFAYLYNLLELKILQGETEEARGLLKRLNDMLGSHRQLYMSGILKYLMFLGNAEESMLRDYLEVYESRDRSHIRFDDTLMAALALSAQGRQPEAFDTLDGLLAASRKLNAKFRLVEALLLKISLLKAQFRVNRRDILNLLREAVYYSFENRILSPFVFFGTTVSELLPMLKEEKAADLTLKEKVFISDIQKLLGKASREELLSERELDVLAEISTGASNKEIGEHLCISLSTVKTHLISIYSKLQAANRVEALEKARRLRLLE